MKNLKIRVNNEAESKEAQELFFELGYKWIGIGAVYYKISPSFNYITAYCEGKTLAQGHGLDAKKEITIPQLKDMVVLKRNDVGDANVCEVSEITCLYDLYLTSSNDLYFYDCGKNKWILSNLNGDEDYLKLLKPIDKNESLNDKVASAEEYRQEQVKNVAIENLEQGLCGISLKSDLEAVAGIELPDFKFPEPLPFNDDLDGESLLDRGLDHGEVNYRVAKAFNVIRGTNLSEDDIHFVRELIALTESHYGGKK